MEKCLWGHKWVNWHDKAEGYLIKDGYRIGILVTQEKRCQRCNAVKLRTRKTHI